MKIETDNSVKDQNATCDNNMLVAVISDEEIEKEMIKRGYYQYIGEFEEDVWDEGKLHWARKCFVEGVKWANSH